jgi:hypothetical protein
MGCFALANKDVGAALLQTLSSMGKVPVLFFATLLVTFPSLYVFNALVGSRLTLASVWRLLVVVTRGDDGGSGVARPRRRVLFAFHHELSVHAATQRRGVRVVWVSGLKFLLHTLHRLTVVLYENAPAELVDESDW